MAISISDMLEEMHSGSVFSLKVCRYDKNKETGGDLLEIDEAILVQPPEKKKVEEEIGRTLTKNEERILDEESADQRHPNHALHYTRNIRILQEGTPTGIIKKIHPPLVVQFNGEETYA